jgi:fatty-acyl-CoA synthase
MDSLVDADTTVPVLDTTIAGIVRSAAEGSPDGLALMAGVADPAERRRWTYAELLASADTAARALAGRFATGERIAVYAPSIPESLILSYAAAMAGLVLVPVNPALRASELAHVLGRSGAAGVFCVDEHRGSDLPAVVATVQPALPSLREVIRFAEWATFSGGPPGDLRGREPRPDDVAQIIFTSGTTGAPKGARLTHRAMTNAARFGAQRFGMRRGDVYVDTMPLFHVGGQVVAFEIVQREAAAVLVGAFEPGLVLELIETTGGTLTVGVPTMLLAMIDHPDFARRDLSTLRSISSGGAVVPPDLVRHIEASLGVQFTIAFGQTETCGFISQTELDDAPEDKAATLGRPLPQMAARVVEPSTGALVPRGAVGELQVRGYNVMAGYHELPDETAAAITADGWLHTGDLVTMDERGYLRIAGRLKEMIVSGGENIFPVEVEAVIATHPAVAQVAVVGVPDRRWGEAAVAVVRVEPGHTVTEDELRAHAREHLAGFKVPKRWELVDELPVNPMGKVQKFLLREQLTGGGPGVSSPT